MSDPRFVRNLPGEIIVYEVTDGYYTRRWSNEVGAIAQAQVAAMQNTPRSPRLPTCSYCGRRVVSLAGDRDATCAGCGAATS